MTKSTWWHPSVPTHSILFDVGVADFNADGNQDLAIVSDSGLFLSLGDGAGGFGTALEHDDGVGSTSLAIGDFNGDRRPDVATCDYDNVAVVLNNGQGGFSAPAFLTVGTEPLDVVTGDFNKDGKLDLAVANFASTNVSILLGNGAGGFGAAMNFTTGSQPAGLAVGDFDGDGTLDLAVSEYGAMDLRIFKGSGSGHFIAGAIYPLGGNAGTVLAADFNRDGKLDLAVNVFNIFPNDYVAILLGNGDGTFASAAPIAVSAYRALAAADLNGDGNVDLAASISSGSSAIEVALGDGPGNFGAIQETAFPTGREMLLDSLPAISTATETWTWSRPTTRRAMPRCF